MALEREYDDDFEAGSCVSSVLCWHNAAQTMLAASLVNQSIVNSDPVPDVLVTDSLLLFQTCLGALLWSP